MYPYLKPNIYLVEGPQAFGIYDTSLGKFWRVSKASGFFLKKLDGTFQPTIADELKFVESCLTKDILAQQQNCQKRAFSNLDDKIKEWHSPKFAWYEITGTCNQNCLHCFLGQDLNKAAHVSLEETKKNIQVLVAKGVKQLIISGGEPTLHPDIVSILEYAATFSLQIALLTNGATMQAQKLAPLLSKHGIIAKIPLLGWDETHDRMTQRAGSFKKALNTILTYLRAGVPVELGTTVTAINLSDTPKIRKFANRLGVKLEVSPLYKMGYATENATILFADKEDQILRACQLDKQTARPIARQAAKQRPTTLDEQDYNAVNLKDGLSNKFECGQKIVALLADGTVSPCLLLRGKQFSQANYKDETLENILSSAHSHSEFDEQMSLARIPVCRDCEARFICKAGNCPASTYSMLNRIDAKNPHFKNCYYLDQHKIHNVGNR